MTIFCTNCGTPMEMEKSTVLFCPVCNKVTNYIEFETEQAST